MFPDEDENTLINQRRAIADVYLHLNDPIQAEAAFKRIIEQYPMNIWSYINWGDV